MLDELDKRILSELNRDARKSFRDLAKILGLAVGTISTRIKRMEDAGLIKAYIPLVSTTKAGYDFRAIIALRTTGGRSLDIAKKIAESSNVCGVYDVTGEFDIFIVGRFKNREHLNSFLKEIQVMDKVGRTNTFLVLQTMKEDPRISFDE
jgi:DNA-binding Lrp family transcriptional regulator